MVKQMMMMMMMMKIWKIQTIEGLFEMPVGDVVQESRLDDQQQSEDDGDWPQRNTPKGQPNV